ncbi:MAG TPA: Ig-like domain-containing protein, partial [Steroidobacteraceae bacterium]|nr:Ig-like domain-containing protein [Steroidobacteraceae bacterium]
MKRLLSIIFGSLLAASTALATTYVRVEKDGTKTYSDRPLPGGQPMDIRPAQTYSAPAPAPTTSSSRPKEEQDLLAAANFRYQCALSPRADETFQNPETVTLSVALTPALRAGDTVTFSMDGAQVPNEQSPTSATLTFPDRGTHTAAVRIV